MAIQIVRLGTARNKNEGIRIGAVRRPPRGIPRAEFASEDWFDVRLPNISPSPEAVKQRHSAKTTAQLNAFLKKFKGEMSRPDAVHILDLLAVLSHKTNFSLGCYCESEEFCHRSILRALLIERGAKVKA